MNAVLGLLLLSGWLATLSKGQGLLQPDDTSLGATSAMYQSFGRTYNKVIKAGRAKYKSDGVLPCTPGSKGTLCATSAGGDDPDLIAQASPPAYFATKESPSPLSAPQDQQGCAASPAFAVVGAAEAAVASVLGLPGSAISLSEQDLYYCSTSSEEHSCKSGWSLKGAVLAFVSRQKQLLTKACMPYSATLAYSRDAPEVCRVSKVCGSSDQRAAQGNFSYVNIGDVLQAQEHIRKFGSVVTTLDVFPGFEQFFKGGANAGATYRCPAGRPRSDVLYKQAVMLVGYDNEQQYWLVKDSRGPSWGNAGYLRVAMESGCGVLNPSSTFGISWEPKQVLPVRQLPKLAGKPGCYSYTAAATDYVSKVARTFGISIPLLLQGNPGVIKEIDGSLAGKQLVICNPSRGVVGATAG